MYLGSNSCTTDSMQKLIRRWIPTGREGTRLTLEIMKAVILEAVQRSPEVVQAAEQLQTPVQLEQWLRAVWTIVPDPPEIEFIRTPEQQLRFLRQHRYLEGDCDDASVLASALLLGQGVGSTLVAVRLNGDDEFSHVFVRVELGDLRLDIDPIIPESQMPIPPGRIAELMTVEVP